MEPRRRGADAHPARGAQEIRRGNGAGRVDVRSRARILELVRELSAVCFSTHYLGEAEQLRAAVAILHEGRVLACDPLADLIASHGDSAVELTFEGPAPAQKCLKSNGRFN